MKLSKVLKLLAWIAILMLLSWVYTRLTDDSMEVHRSHFGYPF